MSKFCSNCGKEVNENAYVCVKCGVKVNDSVKINSDVIGSKSKIAAGLMGIFLGSFGVHNFYLGYTGKAVAQLLITVLSCFFLSFVSGLWGLIECILILAGNIDKDGKGNMLID